VVGGHTLGCSDMRWGVRTCVGDGWTRIVVFGHGLGMVGHRLGWADMGLGWADTGSPILFVRREALGDDCAWRGPLVTLAKR
jgi:hypothetical protein